MSVTVPATARSIADPERCTWYRVGRLVLVRNVYKGLFKRLQRSETNFTWLKELSLQETLRLEQLERVIPISSTVIFRSIAETELTLENAKFSEKQTDQAARTAGWFSSSYWYSTGGEPESEVTDADIALTAEERQLLYNDVASSKNEYEVQDTLQKITLVVGDPATDRWCTISLSIDGTEIIKAKTEAKYEMIRRLDSWKVDVSVETFEVIDCQFAQSQSQHEKLICLVDDSADYTSDPVLFASIEHRPLPVAANSTKRYDYKAELKTASALKIVVNPSVVAKVITIFSPSRDSLDEQFTKEASALYEAWRTKREIELREALTSRQAWICEVEVTAPIIVMPENAYDPNAAVLAIDLGTLRFDLDSMRNSDPWSKELAEDKTFGFAAENLQNHSQMVISSVKVLRSETHVADSSCWREVDANSTIYPIVDNLALRLQFDSSFSTTDQKTLVRTETSAFCVELSPSCLVNITNIQKGLVKMLANDQDRHSSADASSDAVVTQQAAPHQLDEQQPAAAGQSKPERFLLRVFVLRFNAPHIQIYIIDDARRGLVVVHLNSMWLAAKSETASLATSFRLRHVVIEDKYTQAHSEDLKPAYLAYSCDVEDISQYSTEVQSSHSDEEDSEGTLETDLVRVHFEQKQSASSTDVATRLLEVEFNSLHVEWNPETVATVQNTFFVTEQEPEPESASEPRIERPTGLERLANKSTEGLAERRNSTSSSSSDGDTEFYDVQTSITMEAESSTDGEAAAVAQQDVGESPRILAKGPPSQDGSDDTTVLFRVTATMQRFSLSLNKEVQRRKLVQLAMEDVKVEYSECANSAASSGSLGNLSVQDLSPAGATNNEYRELLGLKERGDSLLTFDYEYCSRESALHESKGFDSKMRLHFSPMKFVYIQQQYFELLDYLYAGLLGTIFVKGAEAAAKISQQIEGTRKDLISVNIQSPMILIPTNPTAKEHLLLYADEIVMEHEIDESNPQSPVDHKRVILTGMGLSDGFEADMLEHRVKLIVDVNLKLVVDEVSKSATPEPMMTILADLDDVEVKLSHRQYLSIMDTLDGNIWAAPPETVQQQSRAPAQQNSVVSYQYAVADQPVFTSKYVCNLDKVSLTLTGEDRGVAEASIALMEMRRLKLNTERLPDNTVMTELTLGSITAKDLRQRLMDSPFNCVFKSMVGAGDVVDNATAVVTLICSLESSGKAGYELFVRQTEATCVPATFFMLSSFFNRSSNVVEEQSELADDYLAMLVTPRGRQAVATDTTADLTPVSVRLVFTDSNFKQPYDPASPDMPCDPASPLIELAMNMALDYDREVDRSKRKTVVRVGVLLSTCCIPIRL